jgi:hypothetical protein
MKRFSFLFVLLAGITANAAVKVTPLSANYSAVPPTVTFKVEWQNASVPYNNRVWVWVDFSPVTGTVPAASFSTATISNPAITGGNGAVTGTTARGFFIEHAAATNSGTTVTAALNNASGKFNWCAYGSDMPPNATVNAGGGYTLRGTKPFIINGSQTVNSGTSGAGTCIESITDITGRPDGFATPALTITTTNPAARCGAGAVTLTATAGGGTTNAMTYTWDIGGTIYTNNTYTYTTASLSASAAYTVKVKNANNCESNPASGNITVNYPGAEDQPADLNCGCNSNLQDCAGTCKPSCVAVESPNANTLVITCSECGGCQSGENLDCVPQCPTICGDLGFKYYRVQENWGCSGACDYGVLAFDCLCGN